MNKKGELYSYVSLRDGVESLQKSRSRKPFTRAHLSSREFGNWLWVFTSFPFISSCFLQNLRLACETHHGHPWLSCGRLCGTFGQQDLLWMHWSVLCHFFDLEDIRLLPLQGTLAIRFSPVTEYGWIHFCWWGATYHSPNTEPSPFQFFEVGRLWPVHSSLVTVVATFLVEGRHFICGGRGSIAYVKASECVSRGSCFVQYGWAHAAQSRSRSCLPAAWHESWPTFGQNVHRKVCPRIWILGNARHE